MKLRPPSGEERSGSGLITRGQWRPGGWQNGRRGRSRQILQHPISASEVTALPLTQVEPQGTPFAVADPIELAGHAPLGATDQVGGTPLVEAGRRGMGFEISGVNHQDLWLWGIGC